MIETKTMNKLKVSKSHKGRNYRRIWVGGYYRKVKVGDKIVRRWIEPHWRKRNIEVQKRKPAKKWKI